MPEEWQRTAGLAISKRTNWMWSALMAQMAEEQRWASLTGATESIYTPIDEIGRILDAVPRSIMPWDMPYTTGWRFS